MQYSLLSGDKSISLIDGPPPIIKHLFPLQYPLGIRFIFGWNEAYILFFSWAENTLMAYKTYFLTRLGIASLNIRIRLSKGLPIPSWLPQVEHS